MIGMFRSLTLPFTVAANTSCARRGLMLSAICIAVVPSAYSRMPPSGKVTLIICFYFIGFARGFPRYEMEPPPDFY